MRTTGPDRSRATAGVRGAGAGQALTLGGAATGSAALVAAGAPAWTIAIAIVSGLLLGVVQTVFPQESQHRLAWWRDRRAQRARRRAS